MPETKIVSDWVCQFCGNVIRKREHQPHHCPKCSIGVYRQVRSATSSKSESPLEAALISKLTSPKPPESVPLPEAPAPARGGQPAKRIRPVAPLEVRLARTPSLEALNISATGLLVEYARPFPPGSVCEVELWRSCQGIRLQAEVVRSVVSGGGKGSQTGIRYRTAVHFLDTPEGIFALLPELSESA